jgi:hypothetical protein
VSSIAVVGWSHGILRCWLVMAFVGAERMGEPNLPRFKAESAGGGIDAGQRLVGSYRDYMAMGL